MKILLIVNETPWSSTLGDTALRLLRSMVSAGHEIAAVFFRGDAVYHAVVGRVSDAGTEQPGLAWQSFSEQFEVPLLLCSADAQRRLASTPGSGFREAGLAEVISLSAECQRVISL